ncbi:hypothetical protein GCM10027072_54570 [Streptomyces bullii]
MIPSTKNPAIAQMTPMTPSVARSGPVRDHVRPRERGYLRVPCPKLAIINSLNPSDSWMRYGVRCGEYHPTRRPFLPFSTEVGTTVRCLRAAPLQQRAAAGVPHALRRT